jgi:hypothetical protein
MNPNTAQPSLMMIRRHIVSGIAVLAASALLPVLANVAVAQTAPPRVVETTGGDLHVVYGGNRFTLAPDQISDSDLAALNLGGEIDGVLRTPAAPSRRESR